MTGTEETGFSPDEGEAPGLGGESWDAKFPGSRKARSEGEAANGPAAAALSAFAAELDREGALVARQGTIRASVFREAAAMARQAAVRAQERPGAPGPVSVGTGDVQGRTGDPVAVPDGWTPEAVAELTEDAAATEVIRRETAEMRLAVAVRALGHLANWPASDGTRVRAAARGALDDIAAVEHPAAIPLPPGQVTGSTP